MFRKKKKKTSEQGSGYYVEEDATYENTTMEQGSGSYIEGANKKDKKNDNSSGTYTEE